MLLFKKKKAKQNKQTHTHTASTRPVLDIRLLHTWTPLWICVAERCTGNSPCTLYIYTYIQGCEVVKCCNTCLLPHHVVMITLVWNTRSQPSHVYSLALSLSSLVSAGSRMWQVVRKTDAGMLTPQSCSLSAIMLLEEAWMESGQASLRTELVSIPACHQKGIESRTLSDLTQWLLPSDKWKLYCTCVGEMRNWGNCLKVASHPAKSAEGRKKKERKRKKNHWTELVTVQSQIHF